MRPVNSARNRIHRPRGRARGPVGPGRGGLRGRLAFGALVLLAGLFLWLQSPYFRVQEVIVRGNKRLSRAEVLVLAGVERGMHLWQVSPSVVARRAAGASWLKGIAVRRQLPGRVILEVQEREAVALVPYHGSFLEVDGEGLILGLTGSPAGMLLPIITGVKPPSVDVGDRLAGGGWDRALEVAAAAGPLLRREVAEINITGDGGDLTLYTTEGLPVYLGPPGARLEERLQALYWVLEDIRAGALSVLYIDLRYGERPVVRKADPEDRER